MGRCVFNRKWQNDYTWAKEAPDDKYSAYCRCCRKKIDLGKMGESALKSHARSLKHVNNSKSTESFQPVNNYFRTNSQQKSEIFATDTESAESQSHSTTAPVSAIAANFGKLGIQNFVQKNDTLKAEILWTIQTVISHNSYKANENNNKLFKLMFPDSRIADRFSCGEKKTAYLCVFGIGEYIKDMLKKDLKNEDCCNFVVMFDESLNKLKKIQSKQMDIHIRYWKGKSIVTRYLGSQFMGHATAEDMMKHFTDGVVGEFNTETQTMLQLSMDGPNVNWKFFDNFKKHFKNDYDVSLLNIGSCGLHIAHNAFKSGAEATGWKIASLLSSLYYHFKDSPARREDYKNVAESSLMPLKFVRHRWLENVPVCERALLIWKDIMIYVDKVQKQQLPKPTNQSYEVLASATKDKLIIPKLEFFRTVASHMQKFLVEYQTDRPMIPFVYTDLSEIIENLLCRIMKPEVLKACKTDHKKISDIDLTNNDSFLTYSKIDIGFSTDKALKLAVKNKVSDRQVLEFRMECKSFILSLVKKLLDKCPINYSLVKHLTMLDPRLMKSDPDSCKVKMKKVLTVLVAHNRVSENKCDDIIQNFTHFLDNIPVFGSNFFSDFQCYKDRLDDFFCTHMTDEKYKSVLNVVRMLLLLSHGQASVERGFSVNKEVEVENLKMHSLVSQRLICDYVRSVGGIFNVSITASLLQYAANSRKKYDQYLIGEREKNKTEAQSKKRKALEESIEELKKQSKQARLDHEALNKSADEYSIKAETEQQLSHIAHANSLRQKAKEKQSQASQLQEKLQDRLKELQGC